MAQLFSDLIDGSGRRYFFSLKTAPGGVSPNNPAAISVNGFAPTIFVQTQVFRTPAPAVITLQYPPQQVRVPMQPPTAVITPTATVANLLKQLTISPAVNADYNDPPSNAPTILFIQTIVPAPALINITALELNLSQGGDIGFISPLAGRIDLLGRVPTTIFFEAAPGIVLVTGHEPTLVTSLTIEPEAGQINVLTLTPKFDIGFVWIDVEPPPPLLWTTTTGLSS